MGGWSISLQVVSGAEVFLGGPNPCRTQGADCQGKAETSSEDSSPKKKTKAGAPAPSHHEQLLQGGESAQPEGLFQQDGVGARGLPGSLLIYHLQQTTAFCSLLPSRVTIPTPGPVPAAQNFPNFGAERGIFVPFVPVKEGDLKACGTCAQQRGCGRVCRRTELLIKTARSDAIERLVVTLC